MTNSKTKSIPILLDPDTGDILANTAKQKAQVLNEYYHRHQNTPKLPAQHCWSDGQVINPQPKPLPEKLPIITKLEQEPADDLPTENTAVHEWRIYEDDDYRTNIPIVKQHYTGLLQEHVQAKWKRIQRKHHVYKDYTVHEYYTDLLNRSITDGEIKRTLSSFSNHKAYGPDEMHIRFLKKCPHISTPILKTLLNQLIQLGHIPSVLKKRWITPIIKPGKTGRIPKDLRPVSLTSYIGKILEKIYQYRLVTYLAQLQLLDATQFAYLPGRNTADCITYLIDRIQRNLNAKQGSTSNVIFFDFSSAFDTVQHDILLWKLEHEYFITGPILQVIRSLLTDRFTAVKIDGILSPWSKDTLGVPQGGALSPLFYIIYMDNLGVINSITGLRLGIFADDLAVFTEAMVPIQQAIALQDAIFYIQWYSLHHGLKLNLKKSAQMQFHKQQQGHPPPVLLFFSKELHNDFAVSHDLQPLEEDTQLQATTEPVRYLGVYLDPKLNFKFHSKKTIAKCDRIYYTINSNLRKLWHIPGDIAWILLEVCILSIFDYSAFLWPLFTPGIRCDWTSSYNRILRTTFHTIKGTNNIHILHHVASLDMNKRMELLVSKRFTRLIRAPRGTVIHRLLKRTWWKYIKYQCSKSPGGMLTKQQLLKIKNWGTKRWLRRNIVPFMKTILWHTIRIALKWQNDDVEYITAHLKLNQIQPRITSYMDLTKPWQQIHFDPIPYSDYPTHQSYSNKELLIFPDGSVAKGKGGYGHLMTPSDLYQNWNFTSSNGSLSNNQDHEQHIQKFREALMRLPTTNHIMESCTALSPRCTIEYCEAKAILTALRTIKDNIKPQSQYLQTFEIVQVISDSLTVLNYIRGTFHVRNVIMRDIINNIHCEVGQIYQMSTTPTIFQWTKAHAYTFGNEVADDLANCGRRNLERKDNIPQSDYWKYLTLRAACNRNIHPFRQRMQMELTDAIYDSNFGTTYQFVPYYQAKNSAHPLNWTQKYRHSLSLFTRHDIRNLLAIRTGHNHLNSYRHHRLKLAPISHCICGQQQQTVSHFLTSCTLPIIQRSRQLLYERYRNLDKRHLKSIPNKEREKIVKLRPSLYLTQPRSYTDPPPYYPTWIQHTIQKMIIHFYRIALCYAAIIDG